MVGFSARYNELKKKRELRLERARQYRDSVNEKRSVLSDNKKSDNFPYANSLRLYLEDLRRIPLFTKEEERDYAELIELAKTYDTENDVSRYKREFEEANLRLVIKYAKSFYNFSKSIGFGKGMSLEDLISAGNLGLIRALEKFDYKKGNKFSTYAAWWIKQGIRREVTNYSKNIRIPAYMVEGLHRYKKVYNDLEQENGGSKPTIRDIANRMNKPINKVKVIEFYMRLSEVSLNESINEDTELVDFILDDDSKKDMERKILYDEASYIIDKDGRLDKREVYIFREWHSGNQTLKSIGKKLDLSRERVRQIRVEAEKKLRRIKELRDLVA